MNNAKQRIAYKPPILTCHGTIAALTKANPPNTNSRNEPAPKSASDGITGEKKTG